MFMTLCKKTVTLCALRAEIVPTGLLCLCMALMFWGAPAWATDSAHLPSSPPQTLPDGGPNLNEAWLRHGGARLYWNTLMQPRQLRMAGANFADPAAVPQLMPSPEGQAGGKAAGKSRGGAKASPHSVVINPGDPLLPMRGASRSAVQSGSKAQKASKPAPQVSGQRPASVSPALTAPAASGNGKAAGAQPKSAAGRSAGGAGSGPKSARAPGVNSAAPAATPAASPASPAIPSAAAAKAPQGSGALASDIWPGNGHAVPGAGKADAGFAGNGVPAHAPSGSPAPAHAAPSAAQPALPGVWSGSGAAAGALTHSGVGVAGHPEGPASQGALLPPPVPSLSADDLLPPSNGPSGPDPVRAPLP